MSVSVSEDRPVVGKAMNNFEADVWVDSKEDLLMVMVMVMEMEMEEEEMAMETEAAEKL